MEFAFNPAARWSAPSTWFAAAPARRAAPRRLGAEAASAASAGSAVDALQTLARGATLVIEAPLGQEIFCIDGALWITHDGDPKDHVVDSGRAFVAARATRLVVYALQDARFIVEPCDR
ncbi:MAG: DUF2917 domain-containing protein [Rubrivivax sp.]|nr:DUF2917 domain-containing protein [Rubrivivax sp.]